MAIRERILPAAFIAGAALLCALYPLSAWAIDPLALPALLLVAGLTALVIREPAYGFALAASLAPLINSVVSSGGSGFAGQPLQVLVPALAVGTLLYGLLTGTRSREWGRSSRLLSIAIGAFVLVALIASAQALVPSDSVAKVLLLITAGALFAGTRQVCTNGRRQTIVVAGVLAGLLFAGLQGTVQHFLGIFSTEGFVADFEVVGRVQGSFGHPNLYAGYLATLLPLAVAVGVDRRFQPALRALAWAAAVVALPALYFTFARGATLGLVGGALLWFAVMRPRLAIAVAIAAVVVATLALPATLKERFDPESSGSDVTLRSDIWKSALDIYGDHPVLGVGVNNFGAAYERLPAVTNEGSQRRLLHQDLLLIPPHPQSMYLQSLAEQGLAGAIVLLALVAAALSVLVRAARSPDLLARTLGFGVGIGFTGLLLHGFLEVPLLGEVMLPIFVLLGLTVAALEGDRGDDDAGRPGSPGAGERPAPAA